MKNHFLPLLFLFFTCNVQAENTGPKHFGSAISEVTIYLQGAMVKRTAQVKLEPGNNEIILDGLSNVLDINSVRLESSSAITILSVNASTDYLKPYDKSQREIQLQANLDNLNITLTQQRNEIMAATNELEMLRSNYKISTTGAYVDVLENSADFFRKRIKEVLNDLSGMYIKEKDLAGQTQNLANQINEINNKNTKPYGEITVTASSEGYSNATFTFSYYVTNAGWIPLYNMRAENTASNVSLDYDAEVTQTTGEDWKNVKLILSTGNPSINGIKPKMEVSRLDFEVPGKKYAWDFGDGNSQSQSNAAHSYYKTGTYSLTMNDPNDPYSTKDSVSTTDNYSTGITQYASKYTNLNQNVLATTFEINLQYEILSDGIPKHVRIQQYTLPAAFSYSTLPRVCTDAFLEANITGWEEYNLLPGEVNIFLENGFVGKSFIDPSTTKDTLTVSFGKDKKINIRRVRVKNFTKNQFLGGNKTQSFGYATSIRNTKQTPVNIKVEDQIPVSNQKDIVVELLDGSGAQLDKSTGRIIWTITLQPNEEKAIKFEYTVKYPKGKIVSGL